MLSHGTLKQTTYGSYYPATQPAQCVNCVKCVTCAVDSAGSHIDADTPNETPRAGACVTDARVLARTPDTPDTVDTLDSRDMRTGQPVLISPAGQALPPEHGAASCGSEGHAPTSHGATVAEGDTGSDITPAQPEPLTLAPKGASPMPEGASRLLTWEGARAEVLRCGDRLGYPRTIVRHGTDHTPARVLLNGRDGWVTGTDDLPLGEMQRAAALLDRMMLNPGEPHAPS
jgi:hypothetical protein